MKKWYFCAFQLLEFVVEISDLTSVLGISSRTIAKIAKGDKISAKTMRKIADYFACAPEDLYRKISDNVILQILRDEKEVSPGFLIR